MRRETTCKETEGQRFPEFSEHFNLQIQRDQQICSRINERQIKYNQVTVKLLKTKDKETVWKSVINVHISKIRKKNWQILPKEAGREEIIKIKKAF